MSVVTSITSKPIPSRRKRADCFEWSRAGGAAGRCNASINFTLGGGRGRRRIERLEAVHHPTDLNSIRVSISIRTRDAITFLFARRTGRRWLNLMEYRRKNFRNGGFRLDFPLGTRPIFSIRRITSLVNYGSGGLEESDRGGGWLRAVRVSAILLFY